MKKISLLFSAALCSFQAIAQSITVSETSPIYTQNFDSLAASGEQNVFMPYGWYFHEVGNTDYADGFYGTDLSLGVNPNIYSLGDDTTLASYITNPNPSDRALGLQVHNVFYPAPRIGAKIVNADPVKAIGGLILSYRGETWNQYQATQVDTLKFYYSVDADSLADPNATWMSFPALDYVMEAEYNVLDGYFYNYAGNTIFSSGRNNVMVNGTLPFSTINVAPGESFYISWVPSNEVGTYSSIGGVDDLNMTALFGPVNVGSVAGGRQEFGIETFPVPAADVLNVRTSYGRGEISYTITNSVGRNVKQGSFHAGGINSLHQLVVSDLPAGIYLARFINAEQKSIIINFVKQ